MGFECGVSFIPKLPFPDTREHSDKEYFDRWRYVSEYLGYIENEWTTKNFENFEEYLKACREDISYKGYPDLDTIDELKKFRRNFKLDQYDGYSKNIDFWCSVGKSLDDYLSDHINSDNKIDDYCYLVDDKFLDAVSSFTENDNSLKEVYISRSFTRIDEEDESTTIVSRECDGIEVYDDDSNIIRLYADREWGDELYTGSIDDFRFVTSLIHLVDKVKLVDQDKYVVYYWRSW